MNILYRALTCLMLASLAGITVTDARSAVDAPSQESRTITLAEKSDGGGDSCTLEVKNDTIDLGDEPHGCTHDQMSYIKFDNVRSAVQVELESRGCKETGGWVFVLKTYIDPISTDWISIPALKGQPDKTIITRGVRKMEGRNEDEDSTQGKLSCVRIKVSDLP